MSAGPTAGLAPARQRDPVASASGRESGVGSPRRRARAALLDAGAVVGLTTGLLVIVLRLWDASAKIPFSYPGSWSREFFAGDATFHLMVVRALEQGQWWWRPNPNLGAPLGQDLRDFPLGPDHLHLVLLKGLVALLGDPFAAVNAYYLLGYVLVALSAWGVLRVLHVSRPVAVVVGVLFTFLPYHAGKGPEHLFLAAYVAVPLGGLLLHWHLAGRTAWGPARRAGVSGLTRRRLVAVLACALVLGSGSSYYGLYFLVLLALVSVFQVLAQRDWRPLLSAALLGTPVLVTLVLNAAPALLYAAENGPNTGLARIPQQSWFFGMSLSQLLMPVEDHRLGLFAAAERAQRTASGWQEPGNSLGLVGVVTVLGLAVVLVRRVGHGRMMDSPRARLREEQAGLALLAALVATAGGGSLVIALLGLGEARVWARMSIYIAFFVLVALATWLDDAREWWRDRADGRWAWAVWPALAGLLVLGVWDQTTSADVPAYEPVQAAFDSDHEFFREAHDRLGDGAMVWQLPQVAFPEGGLRTVAMYDYDLFKGYLHAPELRWSYGALKSRPAANWQLPVSRQPLDVQLPMVAAVGFSAVYVDTFGLPDRAAALLEQVEVLLGERPLRSDDGRLVLFDLRPLAERLERSVGPGVVDAAADDLLRLTFGHDFGDGFTEPGIDELNGRWAVGGSAELTLDNPSERTVEAKLELLARSAFGGRHRLRLEGPGVEEDLEISDVAKGFEVRLSLPPGETVLRLASEAPPAFAPTGSRTFFVGDVLVHGPAARQVVEACAPSPTSAALRC